MTLDEEIAKSSREIFTDGYDMSIGEVISLYRDEELIIDPEFQRLFRWSLEQKSRFIESLLLGIPIPPIFVFQNSSGTWELVDGLQRISTILEFMGQLRNPDGDLYKPSIMSATKMLPSLEGKSWDGENTIGRTQQLSIRRARLRVEIIQKESDETTKFSLFQRLNTGGSILAPQEVRNSIMIMLDKEFYEFIKSLSESDSFSKSITLTDADKSVQRNVELVLRLMAYRHFPYSKKYDLNEYLDESVIYLINNKDLWDDFGQKFKRAFNLINECMGDQAFKRLSDNRFLGQFLISAFEVIALGVLTHIEDIEDKEDKCNFIRDSIISVWNDDRYKRNSGSGIRATQRIPVLIPLASEIFS